MASSDTSSPSIYNQLAELPAPISAEFLGSDVIQVKSAIKNHTQNIKRTYSKYIFLQSSSADPKATPKPIFSTPYEEVSARIVAESWSPSKRWKILLVSDGGKENQKRRIEVWKYEKAGDGKGLSSGKLHIELDVTKRHGAFYADEYLASFTWSSDEKSFIYTAEANPPSSKDSDDPYARFRYKPHLGEGLVGKRRPTLFLLHLDHTVQTRQSKLFQLSIPSQPNVLFGQAVFAPSSTIPSNDGQVMIEAIYATGYEYLQDGRLLGVKGCYNRPTGIWEIILPVPIADKATIKGKPKHTEVDNNDDDDTTIRCTARKFTPPYQSCRSPRIYSAANGLYTVVYLVSSTGGAHASTTSVFKFQQLARRRWFNGEGELVTEEGIGEGEDAQPVQLVDFEPTPSLAEPESTASTTTTTTAIATASTTFGNLPGFYPTGSNLPANAFIYTGLQQSTPGPWVISSSAHGSRSTVVLVDTTQRYASLRDLTPPPPPTPSTTSSHPPSQSRSGDDLLWSWNVLTTDLHRRVVCTRSAINRVPEILLGTLDENGDVEWVVIDDGLGDVSEDLKNQLSKLEISVHAIPGRYPTETILVRHVDSTKDTPLVTVPHGGPHGTTTTAFTPTTTALALEGYTISLPNYTGSLGYGENAVRALLGQCGSLDVEDCVSSVRYLIEKGYATEGPGKLFIMGGSHGGFLTAHLIGQYPDMFSAAVLRNPVISCGEISSTDIPDWYFAEFGFAFPMASSPPSHPLISASVPTTTSTVISSSAPEVSTTVASSQTPLLSSDVFAKLLSASPIAYVDRVKTPVLLLIGADDLRVAPTHGVGYYHALRQRGVDVDMLVFEGESHPLEGVEAAKIGYEAGRDWFSKVRGRVEGKV